MLVSVSLSLFFLSLSEISGKFPGNFQEMSREFPGNFRENSGKCPRNFLEFFWKFPGHFLEISWTFPGNFLEFSRIFPGIFPEISWTFPGNFPEIHCRHFQQSTYNVFNEDSNFEIENRQFRRPEAETWTNDFGKCSVSLFPFSFFKPVHRFIRLQSS